MEVFVMRGPDLHDPNRTTTTTGAPTDSTVHHVTHTNTPAGIDARVAEQIRKDAYKAGVSDEKARHKRNPIITVLIALLAVFGLVALVLWAVNGFSFTRGGEVLDRTADRAEDRAAAASREVADEAGEGLQDLGRTVEQKGEQGQAAPPPAQPGPAASAPAPAQ
jgi:hypothetical protein